MSTPQKANRGSVHPDAAWIETRPSKKAGKNLHYVRWVDPDTGKQRSKAAGTDSAFARKLCRNISAKIQRDELSGQSDMTVSQLSDRLTDWMAGSSPHTLRKTRGSLTLFVELIGDIQIAKLTRGHVLDFRAKRLKKVAVASVNKDVRQIRSALSYAVDAGHLKTNPLWRWKRAQLKEPEKRIRVIEPAEFAKLMKGAEGDPQRRVVLSLGYYQGLRRGEICRLRWQDIDFEARTITVANVLDAAKAELGESSLTKSRRQHVAPLHPTAEQHLAELFEKQPKRIKKGSIVPSVQWVCCDPDGHPIKPDWLTHEFIRWVNAAGIDHATPHDLRRSFSTLAQRAGVSPDVVRALGGWSSTEVVKKHYTGSLNQLLRAEMDRIAAATAG